MLLSYNEDAMFYWRELSSRNGHGGACHPVNSKWFEQACKAIVQPVICLGKLKAFWDDKERLRPRNVLGLV